MNQNGTKREQESSWIKGLFDKPTDTWLVVFNGLLVVFTGLLYRATAGLFKETAGLRSAADQQALDMAASLKIGIAEAATAATNLARQDFLSTHRPRLIVRKPTLARFWMEKA